MHHFFNFRRRGEALEILAHDLAANRGVSCEDRKIERGGMLLARFDPIFDRPGRFAIRALDGGGNALGNLCFGKGVGVESFERMVVNVDEAGSEYQAACVNHAFARSGRKFSDRHDAIAADA